jgi:hypothetical protein
MVVLESHMFYSFENTFGLEYVLSYIMSPFFEWNFAKK